MEQVRKYESVVVFDPALAEPELAEETAKVKGILENRGVRDVNVDGWGKKEMSFTVGKHKFGHYVCYGYGTEDRGAVRHLEDLLRLSERVVMFQTHRLEERRRKFQGNPKKLKSKDDAAGIAEY